MIKDIKFNSEATEATLKGINIVADAVKSTYGPNGRNVMIEVDDVTPHITKDGVTVASSIELEDPYESIGANLIKGVAVKTLKDVGDGTTTATILTQAIINEGLKEIRFGVNPFKLKQGIELALDLVVKDLKSKAELISNDSIRVKDIAKISANGDEFISDMLYQIFKVVGKNSIVSVENSSTLETYFEIKEGIQLPNGYDNPLFSKGEDVIIYDKPYVMLSKSAIRSMDQLIPTIKKIQSENKPLVIIAPEMNKDILEQLIITNYQGNLKVVYIQMPGMTEVQKETLDDLSIVIGKEFGIEDHTLGMAARIHIEQHNASLIPYDNYSEEIESLKETILNKINPSDNGFLANKLRERYAKLSSKIATIYVSGDSDVEIKEKKDRLDDAIHAVKAALNEGIVIGAGVTLSTCTEVINAELLNPILDSGIKLGMTLMKKIIQVPYDILNVSTGEELKRVVDPVRVVYVALQNATSIANLFLTTNCVIVNKKIQ